MSSKASAQSGGSSVAFDLGANAVRVVEVEWSGSDGAGRLVKRGTAPLPVNAWNDLPANAAAFSAALRQAMSSAGISARVVTASLPRRLVTLRFARLPHAPPEAMRGLVAFEAQQYVLFPLDEVILDYHVATEGSSGGATPSEDDMESVLLAAARRSLILDLISIFEKTGLELDQLTVSALALAEHIRDSIEATAVIDVEPGEMDVAVVANRQLLFTRASGLDVTGAHPEVAARRLADEIARSFTSFQNEYRNQTLTRINLTGPSVQGEEGFAVEQTLSSVLEMPIGKLSSRLLPATDADAIAYATAIGAALQTRSGNLASINLVPDERAIKKAEAAARQRKQLAVVAGIAAVILGGVAIQHAATAAAAERKAQLAANDKLNKYTKVLDVKRKAYDTQTALYDELNTGLDRPHPSIDVLVALNRSLPQSTQIWLTQFAFERGGLITLHGETKSAEAATDMVIALQESGAFTDVKLAYIGDSQDTNLTSADAPVKVVATPPEPSTPLPGLPVVASANPMQQGGGPGGYGGPNGMRGMNGGYQGGPGGFQGGGPNGYYPGGQNNFQQGQNGQGPYGPNTFQPGQGGPNTFQPGQGGTNTFQPNQNGAPTFQINQNFPNGGQQNGDPNNQSLPGQGTPGGIIRFDPNGGVQVIPVTPPPDTPPPFYLIGYGQDPNAVQDPNGQGGVDPNAQGGDPNAQGGTGTGRRGRRNRGQNGNAQGNQFNQGQFNQGQFNQGAGQGGDPQGANPGGRRGRGNRGNNMGNFDPNSGVTPYGPGSSNMQGPNMQMPQGGQNMMPNGPMVNPTASQPVVTPAPTRKPVTPTTAKPKPTLTSFIITCRINPQARTLITSHGAAPGKGANRVNTSATGATRKPIGEDETPDTDTGGETDGSP